MNPLKKTCLTEWRHPLLSLFRSIMTISSCIILKSPLIHMECVVSLQLWMTDRVCQPQYFYNRSSGKTEQKVYKWQRGNSSLKDSGGFVIYSKADIWDMVCHWLHNQCLQEIWQRARAWVNIGLTQIFLCSCFIMSKN